MVNVYSVNNQLDPVQAMYVNGHYLEELVSGYRTLNVEGREPLTLDLNNIEISTRDGARFKKRRITSRTLTIHFALSASSAAEFATKYNLLKSYLYAIKESEIIFDDESDKYFVGTYKDVKANYHAGRPASGTIEIYCADPFKYSTTLTSVSSTVSGGQTVLTADYDGTYKVHPVITATCDSDNGFYGFSHSNGALLQLGDPEEVDAEDVQRSEMLVDDSFAEGVPAGWTTNDGLTSTPSVDIQSGSFASTGSSYKGDGVCADDYGSGTEWHGPGLNCIIPADSNGDYGAANFKASWMWEAFCYAKEELINIQFNIVGSKNGTKYLLAGIELMDGSPNAYACAWRLWINGAIIQQSSSATNTTTRHDNPWGGITCGECSIQKSGKEIIFKVAGQTFSFENDEYEDLEALEITLYAAGHGTAQTSDHLAFFYVHFRKDAVDKIEDIPNMFMPGDQVTINTEDGTISVNGTEAPDLGAIGNEWEDFVLEPGTNTIVCGASSFASNDSYTMTYREVYL